MYEEGRCQYISFSLINSTPLTRRFVGGFESASNTQAGGREGA